MLVGAGEDRHPHQARRSGRGHRRPHRLHAARVRAATRRIARGYTPVPQKAVLFRGRHRCCIELLNGALLRPVRHDKGVTLMQHSVAPARARALRRGTRITAAHCSPRPHSWPDRRLPPPPRKPIHRYRPARSRRVTSSTRCSSTGSTTATTPTTTRVTANTIRTISGSTTAATGPT